MTKSHILTEIWSLSRVATDAIALHTPVTFIVIYSARKLEFYLAEPYLAFSTFTDKQVVVSPEVLL